MTQIHTHTRERGWTDVPPNKDGKYTRCSERGAHKHTPGWPFLMAVLVCNWYWAFSLTLSSGHTCGCVRACLRAHTRTEHHTERYCFSSGVKIDSRWISRQCRQCRTHKTKTGTTFKTYFLCLFVGKRSKKEVFFPPRNMKHKKQNPPL